jgi:phosphohistidine phosphatase
MKKLIIVRHGKSSWGYENVADIDRPLKNKGIRNSYEMAARIHDNNLIPDIIISSPAIRALHSAIIFLRVLKVPLDKLFVNELFYHASDDELFDKIRTTDNKADTIMIFGHNPTFTSLANKFAKNEIDNIPTTGVVVLSFDADEWGKISRKNLLEEEFDYPKKEVY